MSQSADRKMRRMVANELRKVGEEFGNEKTWEIKDTEALAQRKRAELAGAITRQFINEHKADLIRALNGGNDGSQ
jgi:hypothetical protein